MSDKPKRKGLHCTNCNHGYLSQHPHGYFQCDICMLRFGLDNLEPLHGVTVLGQSNALRYEFALLRETLINGLPSYLRWLFE